MSSIFDVVLIIKFTYGVFRYIAVSMNDAIKS